MIDRRTLTRLTPSVLSQSLSSTMPALLTRIFNEPYSLTVDLNAAEEKWHLLNLNEKKEGCSNSERSIIYIIINNQTRSPKELRVNSPRGEAEWAIDPWPLRTKGLIFLVSPN